jgi:hypothetical protein
MNLKTIHRPAPRGASLLAVMISLVGLLALIITALGIFLYVTHSNKAKLERQVAKIEALRLQIELEQRKATEEARLVAARNHQDELLKSTSRATNGLGQLLAATQKATAEAAALKTGDGGRSVALHPDLVRQARRLYDIELREVPLADDIVTRLESVRRIQLQVADKLGSAYVLRAAVPSSEVPFRDRIDLASAGAFAMAVRAKCRPCRPPFL